MQFGKRFNYNLEKIKPVIAFISALGISFLFSQSITTPLSHTLNLGKEKAGGTFLNENTIIRSNDTSIVSQLNKDIQYSLGYEETISSNSIFFADGNIEITADLLFNDKINDITLVIEISKQDKGTIIWNGENVTKQIKLTNDWNPVNYTFFLRGLSYKNHTIKIYFWNPNGSNVLIRNPKITFNIQ